MTDPAQEFPPAPSTPATGPGNKGGEAEPEQSRLSAGSDGLLAVVKCLSQYQREHEKHYFEAPLTDAILVQRAPGHLYAAAELINHAADLAAGSAVLTLENEGRWRIFHGRLERKTRPADAGG